MMVEILTPWELTSDNITFNTSLVSTILKEVVDTNISICTNINTNTNRNTNTNTNLDPPPTLF